MVYVPFNNVNPSGRSMDFLTGFVADLDANKVYGSPVGVVVLPDGTLLVTDDAGNTIWRVAVKK